MTEAEKLRVAVAALEPYAMRAEFSTGYRRPSISGIRTLILATPMTILLR